MTDDNPRPDDFSRRRALALAASLAALPVAGTASCTMTGPDDPRSEDEPNAWPDDPEGDVLAPAIIAAAEQLAGIRFDESERRTIAATISEQIAIFAR
ncbi:MAG: hypothetical protein VX672_01835, partial [Planctomycetota bacterium]|nr:hypothetical protein [Planctomycetota bacterium]